MYKFRCQKKITSYTFLFKIVKSLQCVSLSWIYLDNVEEGDEMIKTLEILYNRIQQEKILPKQW